MVKRLLSLMALLLLSACPDQVPRVEPAVRAEGLYVHGTALFLQGKFADSQKAFDEMRTILPDDPRLPAALGELMLAQGKLREALEHFERAAAREPKRATNWSRLGFIKAQLGDTDAARSALRRAVALHPRDFNALEALGELDLKDGQLDGAVRHFELAAEASPTDALASLHSLRAARVLTEAGRADDALALLEKAVAKGKADGPLFAELGEHLVRVRRFPEAVQALTGAAQAMPLDPGLWELVGELYVAMDKPGDALGAFAQSLKVKDRALVHLAIARLHKARGDARAAAESLERALGTATGEEAREPVEIARALVEFDRVGDALQLYQVLAREPDNEKDVALQVDFARAARRGGKPALVAEACDRARAADPKAKCP